MRASWKLGSHTLFVVILSFAALFAAGAQTVASPHLVTPAAQTKEKQLWRASMLKISPPAKGCYTAAYPSLAWKKADCAPVPAHKVRLPLKTSVKIVGALFGDIDSQAASPGLITSAQGSFDSVAVTGEADNGGSSNQFSLQLNTNFFSTPACKNAPMGEANCQGWQQFAFMNDLPDGWATVFMQYWLLSYGTCPAGWNTLIEKDKPTGDCWMNDQGFPFTPQNIQSLVNLSILARVEANGTDTVIVSNNEDGIASYNRDSVLTAAPQWQTAEFNVFGMDGGVQAVFNPGTTLVVRNAVEIAGSSPTPGTSTKSFTGETNSLTIVQKPCMIGSPFFAVTFEESNVPGATFSCPQAAPPLNLCKDEQAALAFDQKALATEQQKLCPFGKSA